MDLRTLVLMALLLCLLTGLAVAGVARSQPQPMRAWLRGWAGGLLVLTLGWLLFGLRGQIPDLFSVVLANTLLLAGIVLLLRALRRFHGEAPMRRRDGMVLVAQVLASSLFLWVWPSLDMRILLGSLLMAVVYADTLALVWRRAPRPWVAAHALLAIVQGAMLAAISLRVLVQLLGHGPDSIFQPTPVQLLLHTMAVLAPILSTLGFVLMVAHRLSSELERVAHVDPLTGLANRRQLEQVAVRHRRRAPDERTAISLLLVDVDHFKPINDRYGHEVGDAVLCWLAQRLREEARADDLVVRHGGEEFAVLLPGRGLEAATAVAERLRRRVAATPFAHEGLSLPVSISVGVASGPADALDLRSLLRRADEAMYRAKSAGRNRVEAWRAPA